VTERPTEGFTLIEVLVALAIVAIAFVFAFRVFSGGLSRLDHDHNVQQATLVAQSALARVGRDIALEDREIEGQDEGGFSWRIGIAPFGGAGSLLAHRVVVTVDWNEGWRRREMRVETVRLRPL
jgi:general secretion pathway protein I